MRLLDPMVRRARPLLGTFVEVRARGGDAERGVRDAFAAIERAQGLLSAHDSASDVGRLNAGAHRNPVRVHPWTTAVLTAAWEISRGSAGLFDVTVGARLAEMGFLEPGAAPGGSWRDVVLMPRHTVRFLRPLRLDLGGIAKGFAIDRAMDALQEAGVEQAVVNAGGDLRVMGPDAELVHVRDPRAPGRLIPLLELSNAALASSGPYFSGRRVDGRRVSALHNPLTRGWATGCFSVSVRASTAMHADALTKVAASGSAAAEGMVRAMGGEVYCVGRLARTAPR